MLDFGTGTGVWAIEYAQENPVAEVVGVDLSPVQPSSVPANCEFHVADVEQDWQYDKPFDYIHCRFLSMGIRDWPRIFRQTFANLKSGCWAEFQEAELIFPVTPDSPKTNKDMQNLSDDVQNAAVSIGVDIRQAHSWKESIESAGFVNHHMVKVRWPGGEWSDDPKEKVLGRMNRLNLLNAMEALSLGYLVRVKGDPEAEVRERIEKARSEIRDDDCHIYMNL